jgi:hypothetical protein
MEPSVGNGQPDDVAPSADALYNAARVALESVPATAVQSASLFAEAVARRGQVSDLDPTEIRHLAASALRIALDHDLASGEFSKRARRRLYQKYGDLDADEVAHTAFLLLRPGVDRYEQGIGKYGGSEPALFPVEKSYLGWIDSYVFRAARKEIEERRRMHLMGGMSAEPEAPPPAAPQLRHSAEGLFARARRMALYRTPLHPDLRATLAGRRTETGRWRETCTRLATVEALNAIEQGVEDEPVANALDAARGALRAVAGILKTAKMLDKRVSRYVSDVLYAVTESLRFVVGPPPTEDRALLVWRYVTLEVVRWHAAQLEAAVSVLADAMGGEITTPARIDAIVDWAEELVAWLRCDVPYRAVVTVGARAALDACLDEARPPSPIQRARDVVGGGDKAVVAVAVVLVNLHDALVESSDAKEAR